MSTASSSPRTLYPSSALWTRSATSSNTSACAMGSQLLVTCTLCYLCSCMQACAEPTTHKLHSSQGCWRHCKPTCVLSCRNTLSKVKGWSLPSSCSFTDSPSGRAVSTDRGLGRMRQNTRICSSGSSGCSGSKHFARERAWQQAGPALRCP